MGILCLGISSENTIASKQFSATENTRSQMTAKILRVIFSLHLRYSSTSETTG